MLLTVSTGNTLDGPLEEGFAGLAGRDPVVKAGGHVATDQAHSLGAYVILVFDGGLLKKRKN